MLVRTEVSCLTNPFTSFKHAEGVGQTLSGTVELKFKELGPTSKLLLIDVRDHNKL